MTVYLLSYVESCYDRQIPVFRGLVEEVVRVDRSVIKLMSKVVETFKHYVCTGFGINKESWRGRHEKIVGTGQGNIVSGATCRD